MTTTNLAKALILLLTVTVTGCERTAPHTVKAVSPAPVTASHPRSATAEPTPSIQEADSVALYSIRAVEASDTAVDSSPTDTFRRAAAWLAPSLSATVSQRARTADQDATWSTWVRHRAYLVVRASLAMDDHPPDTTKTARRQVYATITPIGRDGWRGVPHTEVLFVTLTPVHGSWRLAAVHPG